MKSRNESNYRDSIARNMKVLSAYEKRLLRKNQLDVVAECIHGQDMLVLLPTRRSKNVCCAYSAIR